MQLTIPLCVPKLILLRCGYDIANGLWGVVGKIVSSRGGFSCGLGKCPESGGWVDGMGLVRLWMESMG